MDDPAAAPPRWLGPVIGLVTAGVTLGVAHLVAGWVNAAASPVITVGEATIDSSPTWLKSFAIRSFGANDKQVLLLGIGLVIAAAAIAIGNAALRRPRSGWIGLAILAGVGVLAAITRPNATAARCHPGARRRRCGRAALRALLHAARRPATAADDSAPASLDRRHFLWTAGVGAVVAIGAGGVGGFLSRRFRADESRASVRIPAPSSPAADAPAVFDAVDGISPFITPNAASTGSTPRCSCRRSTADGWQLRIHGMVEPRAHARLRRAAGPAADRARRHAHLRLERGRRRPRRQRALARRAAEGPARGGGRRARRRPDRVRGPSTGSPPARRRRRVHGRARRDARGRHERRAAAGRSTASRCGWSCPGLYGYVSATKWVVDLELTTFDAFDAYWIPRGWAQQAPIKTESRIDTPRDRREPSRPAGRGGRRGLGAAPRHQRGRGPRRRRRVAAGELGTQDTVDTWRQWVYRWDATAGRAHAAVRATDGDGAVQTADLPRRPPTAPRATTRSRCPCTEPVACDR